MVKVMIFDDDRTFSIILKKDLEVCGYSVVVRFTGVDAIDHILKNAPDLILINYNLPVVSGCEVVSEIRKMNVGTPVIFFSSENDANEVVNSFESGGNDYIRKPIELRELLARMKNQLPNVKLETLQEIDSEFVRIKNISFDFLSNNISQDGRVCQITKTQALIIKRLLTNKGQIVPFETIVNECLNSCEFTVDAMNSMKVILCKLRKNLENKGITGLRIETYRRKGICLYI